MPCWLERLKFALKEKEGFSSLSAEVRRFELARSVVMIATKLELAGNFATNSATKIDLCEFVQLVFCVLCLWGDFGIIKMLIILDCIIRMIIVR